MIYADYAATTPIDPRVLDAMMPYLTDTFANAASTHMPGLHAQRGVMGARLRLARHIGAKPSEIVFTSGATEALNLAILGVAKKNVEGTRKRIVTVATEHLAVLDTTRQCAELGYEIIELGVRTDGTIDHHEFARAVTNETLLVSVMFVNNETGVVQNLQPLTTIAEQHGAVFLTDATQAYGKVPINVQELGVHMLACSAHKIYGPKGVGMLFVRGDVKARMAPQMFGGGQEHGLRSGTMNVPGVVGFAEAGELAYKSMAEESARILAYRNEFEDRLLNAIPWAMLHGGTTQRSYNICNIGLPYVHDLEALMGRLATVACSKGSACSSAKPKPSHVLLAMGKSADVAQRSLRFSFGRFTTHQDIECIVNELVSAITLLETVE
jgi:cysteine desulfurase